MNAVPRTMGKKKRAKAAAQAEHKATRGAARHHDSAPARAISAVADVADQPPLIAIGIGTLAVGAVLRQPTLVRAGSRMLASHLLATGLKTLVKRNVDRTRPAKALAAGGHRVGAGKNADDSNLNSFPSGHTAGIVAVAEAIAHEIPAATAPARLAAGAIGSAQLPTGKHYLSDVAAGAAIGWLSERIAGAALDIADHAFARFRRDRAGAAAEAEAEAHPS